MKARIEIPKGWKKLRNGQRVYNGDRFFNFCEYPFKMTWEKIVTYDSNMYYVNNEVVIRKIK